MSSTSGETIRGGALAAALLGAAIAASGCMAEPEAHTCSTGIYCPAGSRCAARQPICIMDNCGDGLLQQGEACDDGNKIDGDGCSADCKSNETCGNQIVDEAAGEVCDDGNTVSGDGCSADCTSKEGCGNGNVDPGEQCDTGGESPVCNANCTWARCGDGIVNDSAGEQCDRNGDGQPGANGESASCNGDCTLSFCGDGKLNATSGERCDDGPLNASNADCLPNCEVNRCGDGFVDQAIDPNTNAQKEGCDEGADNSYSGSCLPDCRKARCGDGHVEDGVEQCDTGPDSATVKTECPYGQRSCTLCSACLRVPSPTTTYCGDGITDTTNGEVCDSGPQNGATSCDYGVQNCQICDSQCSQLIDRTGPYCGDGARNGAEACDDGNKTTETECLYGYSTCTLCNADCSATLTPPALKVSFCGDGKKNGPEQCDGAACGACNAPGDPGACTWITPLPPATGTITVASTAVADGDLITISDGVHPVTFEIDTDARWDSTHRRTFLPTAADTVAIAAAIRAAIADPGSALGVNPSLPSGGSTISLTNVALTGTDGNQEITTSNSSGAIVVTGMAGGLGCKSGLSCWHDEECVTQHCQRSSVLWPGQCKP